MDPQIDRSSHGSVMGYGFQNIPKLMKEIKAQAIERDELHQSLKKTNITPRKPWDLHTYLHWFQKKINQTNINIPFIHTSPMDPMGLWEPTLHLAPISPNLWPKHQAPARPPSPKRSDGSGSRSRFVPDEVGLPWLLGSVLGCPGKEVTGWWQLQYFWCSPQTLGKISNLTSIFFKRVETTN